MNEVKNISPRERIKYYRETIAGLSQSKFAQSLEISKSNLANIEVGRVNLTDRVINNICDTYNINEEWLRTGEGPMEKQKTRDEEILSFIDKIKETDNVFAKRFIMALSKLSYDEWKTIDKLITNYSQMSALCDEETAVSENLKKPDNKLTPAEKRAIVNGEIDQEEKEVIL
jgi:transcriptional regulator with XRE-family HTH domain|nr:MAG TPA: helix-turn-helix domain protein [Caudoviricetes sp.]